MTAASTTKLICLFLCFFFNDTVTTEIYTLSLHDALPISASASTSTPSSGARERSRSDLFLQRTRGRSEEHTSELQSPDHLVCRLLLEKKKTVSAVTAEYRYCLDRLGRTTRYLRNP